MPAWVAPGYGRRGGKAAQLGGILHSAIHAKQEILLLLALIGATALFACQAHADDGYGNGTQRESRAAQRGIASASRRLDRAALQWEFTSRADELLLLQSARDRLGEVVKRLCCTQRDQAEKLEADIGRVVDRAAVQLGPLRSATGASYGPPGPSRAQLASLAQEGQDLVHRAPPTVHPGLAREPETPRRRAGDAMRPSRHEAPDLANAGLFAWPPDKPAATTQFQFYF
jgi:hypothetical protein